MIFLPRYLAGGALFFMVDLKIEKGKIQARVQGRRETPYKVEIRISPFSEQRCQSVIEVIEKCSNQIENIEALLTGDIPDELKELLCGEEGLFPSQREISFSCSCPDRALMCKHVAAVLYGIGVRFDQAPLLFFTLRGVDVNRFVTVALENRVEQMLMHADVKSDRIMEDADITALFGIV
ncbi:MAG: SWIM zinc finger family protein [Lachnospiraceae bacterium]|nr:SWIM zinc finger family protein [Lachnospiraceae bacterium]